MARILITGASGLLGSNLAREYAVEHEVNGVYYSHRLVLPGVKMIRADLTDPELVELVLGKVQPDLVIHCAAGADVDRCERDPDWAWRLNRDMAADVAAGAAEHDAELIHISTDAVFDGEEGNYDEDATPRPRNVYGESKLAGERAVLDAYPEALVVRTNLFGLPVAAADGRGLLAWFLRRFERGDRTPGFVDVSFSPQSVHHLAEWLLDLVEPGAAGVIHLGGRTCLSKFEFGRRAAQAFGYDPDLVVRASLADADLLAPRPKNLCLDSSRAAGLVGRALPDVQQGLERVRRAQGERAAAPADSGSLGRAQDTA